MKMKEIGGWLYDSIPYEVRRRSSGSWMLPAFMGLGLGALAGVGLGVLIAPAAGTETRRQLKNGAVRLKERARVAASHARHRVAGELNKIDHERSFVDEIDQAV